MANKQDRKTLPRDYWLMRRYTPSLGQLQRARARYIHISVQIVHDVGKLPRSVNQGSYIRDPFRIEVAKNRFITKGRNARKRGEFPK